MTDDKPAPAWFTDRASARTPAERETRYQDWLDTRELEDTAQRRALHFRRYSQPEPPEFIPPISSLKEFLP